MQPFPDGFLWGNSTSSMQTEGATELGGKGPSTYDLKTTGDWAVAIDEYHRYEEDFDLMAQAGMSCYRFQIAWSRVCPTGDGAFNEEGIQFYADLIDALLARNITPMVCLYHFDMPLALARRDNGFMSRRVVNAFVRFAKEMIDRFADKVPYWVTFNEQNLYSTTLAFDIAGVLTGPKDVQAQFTIAHHVMVAHALVANYLHAHTDAKIGGMLAYEECYAASSAPEDAWYARQIDVFLNQDLLDVFTGRGDHAPAWLAYARTHGIDYDAQPEDAAAFAACGSDFLAFSYYRSHLIAAHKVPLGVAPLNYLDDGMVANPHTQANEWGWNVDPLGFRDVCSRLYQAYRLPVFPIENGLGLREDSDGRRPIQDPLRIDYHRQHLLALKAAIQEDGVPVMGYLGWGLIDIPSSSGSMAKRYGMVYVNRTDTDRRDLRRVPKASYDWFKQVIASNGATL